MEATQPLKTSPKCRFTAMGFITILIGIIAATIFFFKQRLSMPLTKTSDCFAHDRCNVSCIIENYGYPSYQKQSYLAYPQLRSGEYLVSQNMKHCLYLAHDGALKVMTGDFSVDVIRGKNKEDGPYTLKMGRDRLYLMAQADSSVRWEIKTKSSAGYFPRLVMQNDRNIVVYSWFDEQAVWISGTKLLQLDQNFSAGALQPRM
jgi:hypothetical protein